MSHYKTKVLIIGSGPAAYTAAIYTSRANLSPIQLLGLQPGGQLMLTTDVENYPGFHETIQGPFLMEEMQKQAKKMGTEMIQDTIQAVDLSKRPFHCQGETHTYETQTLIICTGAQARWLGVPGEKKYQGYGVSACATCDGFFFKGKPVAVIGGGNTAVEEALYLTNFTDQVTLVHRRDHLRAEKILQDRLFKNKKISVLWNKTVEEIEGKEDPLTVTHLQLKDTQTFDLSSLKMDGVFVAIGHTPSSEIFKGQLDIASDGYIITKPDSTATNIAGVFAAGDVQDRVYRQAVTAAGQGCMAALEAERYLSHL